MNELRMTSLRVKSLILRHPGLTSKAIIRRLSGENHDCLVATIRLLTGSGMVIYRNNRYYALGHSVKAMAKRNRLKRREQMLKRQVAHQQ
jgi:hypothetical protein